MTDRPPATSGRSPDQQPPVTSDEALRQLYDAHGSVLISYLMKLTRGDRHRAEDILQETLLRAWRHPEARRPDGEWSRAWLFTVARRLAIDHARAVRSRPMEFVDPRIDERPRELDEIERLLDTDLIREALLSLPDRLRGVLIEVYFRERSVDEAAAALGVPPGTVKSRTFYALRALRDALVARGFTMPPRL